MPTELNLVEVPETHFLFTYSHFVCANLEMKIKDVSFINIFFIDGTYLTLRQSMNDSFFFPNYSLNLWQLHDLDQYDSRVLKNIFETTGEDMPLHKALFMYDELLYRNHNIAEEYFKMFMSHACIVKNMVHQRHK
jgi:hypothetical protein